MVIPLTIQLVAGTHALRELGSFPLKQESVLRELVRKTATAESSEVVEGKRYEEVRPIREPVQQAC